MLYICLTLLTPVDSSNNTNSSNVKYYRNHNATICINSYLLGANDEVFIDKEKTFKALFIKTRK
jgi:hypothetical protein